MQRHFNEKAIRTAFRDSSHQRGIRRSVYHCAGVKDKRGILARPVKDPGAHAAAKFHFCVRQYCFCRVPRAIDNCERQRQQNKEQQNSHNPEQDFCGTFSAMCCPSGKNYRQQQ